MLCRLLVIIRLFHIIHLHPKTPQVAKFVVVLLHEAQRGRDGWRSRINNLKHRGNAEIMVKFFLSMICWLIDADERFSDIINTSGPSWPTRQPMQRSVT